MDDCNDCKENEYMVYVYPEKDHIRLHRVLTVDLKFTEIQTSLILKQYPNIGLQPIFIGKKKEAMKVLDIFIENEFKCEIKSKQKEIFK